MRVLLAVHAFPPRSVAGVEVYTLRLARALQALGHDVLVLAAAHDLDAEPYSVRRREHEGVPVAEIVSVHHLGTLEATYQDPGIDRAGCDVLRHFAPEIVHIQHLLSLSSGLIMEARRKGAAVLFTLHDYWLSCPRDGLRMQADLTLCASMDHAVCAGCLRDSPYLTPPLQRGLSGAARSMGLGRYLHRIHDAAPATVEAALRLLRRATPRSAVDLEAGMDRRAAALRAELAGVNLFLAPTLFARDRGVEFGVPSDRVRVVPLGAVLGPARGRAARARRPRIGFVGTLAPHKGAHVLLKAFAGIESSGASLDFFGSRTVYPAYVEELQRAAAGDPRVRFHGPFAEGRQADVFAGCDVLALPSVWWENSPLTVLEALAHGLPVVASAIGGVPEIVADGRSGLLVPPGDVTALRLALSDVIEGKSLAAEAPPLALATVADGAQELAALYAELRNR